ncbi:hypothetical protein KI387_039856, partial [Taxus chinensis]
TAALCRAAVTGPPPYPGRRSRDRHPGRVAVSSLKTKMQEKRGAEGKTKHAEAERGMRDTN